MNSFNKALQKLCNATFKGFYVFAAFTFTVLLTILLVNVISRNLLGGSIAWIEEISRYIFTWMMFMGIAIGVHYKKHLGDAHKHHPGKDIAADVYGHRHRRPL